MPLDPEPNGGEPDSRLIGGSASGARRRAEVARRLERGAQSPERRRVSGEQSAFCPYFDLRVRRRRTSYHDLKVLRRTAVPVSG